jgi:hypothetical protein
MKNKYIQLKDKQQEEINNFPCFFAFSEEQFNGGLKKLKTTKENIGGIGFGGFIRKEDKKSYLDMLKNHNKEMEQARKDDLFLYEMFYYELANHEFIITYDYTDTLNCLGLKYEDLNERQINILEKAKTEYLNNQD